MVVLARCTRTDGVDVHDHQEGNGHPVRRRQKEAGRSSACCCCCRKWVCGWDQGRLGSAFICNKLANSTTQEHLSISSSICSTHLCAAFLRCLGNIPPRRLCVGERRRSLHVREKSTDLGTEWERRMLEQWTWYVDNPRGTTIDQCVVN